MKNVFIFSLCILSSVASLCLGVASSIVWNGKACMLWKCQWNRRRDQWLMMRMTVVVSENSSFSFNWTYKLFKNFLILQVLWSEFCIYIVITQQARIAHHRKIFLSLVELKIFERIKQFTISFASLCGSLYLCSL